MAWRYKASKYKNAAPKFLKKEETITGLPVTDVGISCGNHIKSSCVYVAFNVSDLGGASGSIGFLPLSARGRQSSVFTIKAHSDFASDFDFNPFDDYLLASGSHDGTVKLWCLPVESDCTTLSEACATFSLNGSRVSNVLWHPSADGILVVTNDKVLSVLDFSQEEAKCVFDSTSHEDLIHSVCWKGNGSLLATSCKDKKLRVVDPRANQVVQEGQSYQNVKDSRVIWVGDTDFLLSTGFTMTRSREVTVWDQRNLKSSLNKLAVGTSNGTVMPFYDPDTSMTFLVGKGDNTLNYLEFTEKTPYLTEANVSSTEQIKGACLVPKRAMNLMEAEVNRLMVLCQNSIIPVPYIVPRKTYREFHEDIYPDTRDGVPGTAAPLWMQGNNEQPPSIKLQPGKNLLHMERKGALFTPGSQAISESVSTTKDTKQSQAASTKSSPPIKRPEPKVEANKEPPPVEVTNPCVTTLPSQVESPPALQKVHKPFHKTRQSKYRYIQGKLEHPNTFTTNLRNVSKTLPGESNMFAINETRCAVPLDGAGGCLQVLELGKPTRLPDTGNPVIQNGNKVADYAWDPFDESRLLVGLDSAKINVWRIPDGGLTESMETPEFSLWGHQDRIFFISFHPLASDIVATGSLDMTVRIWDLSQKKDIITLQGHEDQIFCFAWSNDGSKCATVARDGKVRIFDPRKSTTAIKVGKGPAGQRGARVVWALKDKYLLVTGFDKSSRQLIRLYDAENLKCLDELEMDTSPSIPVPHYDSDCSVVYLTSRGERTIHVVDVSDEEPHLISCAPLRMESLHQAAAYLPKRVCDVHKIEIGKGWRLTLNSVEAMTFTVPRVKPQYFQDDLFPPTAVSWEPSMSSSDWLAGKDKQPALISLCPSGMQPLSQAPIEAPKPKKFESYNVDTYKTDEQKKEELLSAMVGKLEISEDPLPQDLTEGVDDDEWDD